MNFVFIAAGMGNRLAGGDVIAVEVAKRLAAQGHRLAVLTSAEGSELWRAAGVQAEYWVVSKRRWPAKAGLAGGLWTLTARLLAASAFALRRRADASAIVATSDMLQDVLPGLLLRGRDCRRLAIFHMVNPSPLRGYARAFDRAARPAFDLRAGLNFLQQRLALLLLRCYDVIVTQTPSNRRFLERKLGPGRVFPRELPYGVEPAAGRRRPAFEACWVGRYHPQKGLDDLLRVWRLVVRERPGARLAVVGDVVGPLAPAIEAMGLERNVICLGFLEGAAKQRVLQGSRLFLFPSRFEGKPVAVAEALACGLPVVAYDLPVYEGAFAGGLVRCPLGDVEAMAKAVVRLLDDGAARRALSRSARKAVAGHTWEASAGVLLAAAGAESARMQ